jgi:formylglycine-generating enzyme required for sulfatase activity
MARTSLTLGLLLTGALFLSGFGFGSIYNPTPDNTPTPTLEPVDTADDQSRAAAEKGVEANADWKPHIEEINGVKMALVPTGCFQMGSTDEQIADAVDLYDKGKKNGANTADPSWFADEKPRHRVCFEKPFWIDVTEVTNAQFKQFGGQSKYPSFRKDANRPREQITWPESDAFCRKRGARLPSEAEWEYAARGPDGLIYPWGNTWDSSLVVWNLASKELDAEVGSKPGGISWVGALDMIGNVNEWLNDWYAEDYYASLEDGAINPQGPVMGTKRVIRGSSYYEENPVFLHAAFRASGEPKDTIATRAGGFRCALSY